MCVVIDRFYSSVVCHSKCGELLFDAFSLFFCFPGIWVGHVFHEANEVTYGLTRLILGMEDTTRILVFHVTQGVT